MIPKMEKKVFFMFIKFYYHVGIVSVYIPISTVYRNNNYTFSYFKM